MIAETKDDLPELITKVKISIEEVRYYLNVKKTKVVTTGKMDHIIVDDNNIEIVDKFISLGILITNDEYLPIRSYEEGWKWENVPW